MSLTRRLFLSSVPTAVAVGGATTPAAMAIPARTSGNDPMFEAIQEYRVRLAEFMAIPDGELTPEKEEDFVEATYGPSRERLWLDTPTVTSLEGVREVIRMALDENAFICKMSEKAMLSALRYLDVISTQRNG